ncbi:hypothetical protein AB0J68_24940, partial [Micromonospora sp. NPDC049580]|uniref:hypothetical protein n=1 Tax=Micromonospora sp. NPDC049580 TaxID=3154832 RepID=UPI00342C46CC
RGPPSPPAGAHRRIRRATSEAEAVDPLHIADLRVSRRPGHPHIGDLEWITARWAACRAGLPAALGCPPPRDTDAGHCGRVGAAYAAAVTNQQLRLSVGASAGQRTVAVVTGVLVAAIGAAFVLVPLLAGGLVRRLTGPGDGFASYEEARDLPPGMLPPALRESTSGSEGPGPFLGLCGLPFVLLGVYLVLRVLRTAAWLDGSRVRVRGAIRSRTVDLAIARVDLVRADASARAGRSPGIVVTDRASGHRVTIPLRGMGLPVLPPSELRALADAFAAGRPGAEPSDEARAVAADLRRLADA